MEIFKYFSRVYEGRKISFRQNIDTGEVDIQFDDNFAISNGYESLNDLINQTYTDAEKRQMKAIFGDVPKWVRCYENGMIVPVQDVPSNDTMPIVGQIAEA